MDNKIYFRQKTNWTCGPACLRMLLKSIGISKSEEVLTKSLKTNKRIGTKTKEFVNFAKRHKLNFFVQENSTIGYLKTLRKQKYCIMICYTTSKEKDGHYAIIKKINKKYVSMLDPWEGTNYNMSISYFQKSWKYDYEHKKRWLFAIKK